MTEPSTSAVEQAVQARIAAARIRVQAAKETRASLAEARKAGLAHRHARKLLNLRGAETRAGVGSKPTTVAQSPTVADDDQDDAQQDDDTEES